MTRDDKKLLIGLVIAGTLVAGVATALSLTSARRATASFSTSSDARPHNGGKVSAPVAIQLSAEDAEVLKTLAHQTPSTVTFSIFTEEECSELVVKVQGRKGIEIQAPRGRASLGACTPGIPQELPVTVIATDLSKAGHIAVTVRMRGQENRTRTAAFRAVIPGAEVSLERLGSIKAAPSANEVVEELNSN